MEQKTILFVDDEENILKSLNRVFRKEGYNLLFANSGEEGLELARSKNPEIVVSDQRMPKMTGVVFLNEIKELLPDSIRILLTGYADIKDTIDAINKGGVYRYLSKPWKDDDIKLIIRDAAKIIDLKVENKRLNTLTLQQNKELTGLNTTLEQKVLDRTQDLSEKNMELKSVYGELEENFFSFIRTYIGMIELVDPFLGNHSKRVSTLSKMMGHKLGLSKDALQTLEIAALLHDIGMVGIPNNIVETTFNELNREEAEIFKQHAVMGEAILSPIKKLSKVATIIRSHHEHFDGTGFPDKLCKTDIVQEARIISVVDTFDEVKKIGLYKDDPDHTAPISFLRKRAGTLLDPELVQCFFEVLEELKNKKIKDAEISAPELKPGMIVSRDIFSDQGLFLIAKDTLLNKAYIQKIIAYNKMAALNGRIFIYLR